MAIARSSQDKWHSRAFGRSNTKGGLGLFLSGLLTSAFLVLSQPARSQAQASIEPGEASGTLVAAVDEVQVNQGRAVPGRSIAVSDAIETNASGRARLSFLSQTSVQIAGNTELKVARLATSNDRRVKAVILDFSRGVGRVVIDDRGQRSEVAVIRGESGGAVVILESGTLDAVVSGNRLVAVLRRGRATCRAANAQTITLRTGQSACVLTGGDVRPSQLSAAMDRVIDERLSFPPSSVAVSQTGAERALMDYAVNDLSPYANTNSSPDPDTTLSTNGGGQLRLQRTADGEQRDDSLMQFIVRQLSQSSER